MALGNDSEAILTVCDSPIHTIKYAMVAIPHCIPNCRKTLATAKLITTNNVFCSIHLFKQTHFILTIRLKNKGIFCHFHWTKVRSGY